MNWDGAISMSKCLHGMVWVSIQEHNSSATVCHVNQHGLILFGILEGAHCSFVISSPSGLASWTLIVTALLKFLTLSASAILTSDETLVSITWLRCWLEFQQVRLLSVRGHLSAAGGVEQCVTTWFLQSVDLSSVSETQTRFTLANLSNSSVECLSC